MTSSWHEWLTMEDDMNCDSCEVLYINGIKCHEHGCRNAWMDSTTECFECGCDFYPSYCYQAICDDCIADREYREELSEDCY